MQHSYLDFVDTRRPTRAAGWLLLVVGLSGSAAVFTWHQLYLQPFNAANAAKLQSLEASQAALPKMNEAQMVAEWTRAITVADELNLPWEKLFATFEAKAVDQVALLSLDPDVGKRELTLTGEAKNLEAMLAYYRWLQQQPIFTGLALHTHQINRQDQQNPIRFRITAKWMTQS